MITSASQQHSDSTIEMVLSFEPAVDLAALDVHVDDTCLKLSLGEQSVTVPWAGACALTARAKARLSKRARRLVVSAPVSHLVGGERQLRVTVPRGERGTHRVTFRDHGASSCYALVSKSGDFATAGEPGSFQWAAEVRGDGATIELDTGAWQYDCDDACITFASNARAPLVAPAPIESWRALDGVRITAAAAAGVAADGFAFLAERETLLTAELRRACAAFDAAYRRIDGHALSTADKARVAAPRWPSADAGGDVVSDDHRVSLTYGEAHFCPLYRLLLTAGVRPGDTLVDLGSGTGRVVLGAALAFPSLRQARGYEILPALHAAALAAHGQLRGGGCGGCGGGGGVTLCDCAPVTLVEADFLEADWSDASVLFATSLCFPYELSLAVEERARRLAPGARVIVMSQGFGDASEGCFRPRAIRAEEPRNALQVEMDFGAVLFYVFERT